MTQEMVAEGQLSSRRDHGLSEAVNTEIAVDMPAHQIQEQILKAVTVIPQKRFFWADCGADRGVSLWTRLWRSLDNALWNTLAALLWSRSSDNHDLSP